LLACSRAAIGPTLNEGGRTSGVKGHRFVGECSAKGFQYPFRRRSILTEYDGPVQVEPAPLPQIVEDHLDLGIDVRAVHHRGEVSFDVSKQLDFLRIGRRIVRWHSFVADFVFGNHCSVDPAEKMAGGFKACAGRRSYPSQQNRP
jgi:hypothetical protein